MKSVSMLAAYAALVTPFASLAIVHPAVAMELQARGNPNLCVDLNQSNGQVALWTCNAGANQNFFGGYGQQRFGNLCLDQMGAAGAPLAFTTCNANSRTQRWGLSPAGELKNEAGYCLDVPYGNVAQGQRLQMYQCNNGGNQKWAMSPARAAPVVNVPTPAPRPPLQPNPPGIVSNGGSGIITDNSGGLIGKIR